MAAALPSHPNLDHLKKQAKDLLKSFKAGDTAVCALLQEHLPRFADLSPDKILAANFSLHDAQQVIACEYGFENWSALRQSVEDRAQQQRAPARAPAMSQLSEKLQRHIDALGFHSVGAYRIWCHKQGLSKDLDKDDEQLQQERELFTDWAATRRPPFKKDYRPAQVRFLTLAYEGKATDLWQGWTDRFANIEDPAEREALYRLLVQCEKYARIDGPSVWQLARHHGDWLLPVEDWFPASQNAGEQLADLTRYLLGHDDLPPAQDLLAAQSQKPSVHYARTRAQRQTIFTPDEIADYEALGYLRVKEAFPRAAALEMQDFMWSELKRMHGILRDDSATWPTDERLPQKWTSLHLNQSKNHNAYDPIATPRLMQAYEELAGEQQARYKQSWGAFIVNFPERSGRPWGLDHRWSIYNDPDRAWMLRVALFFSDVGPRAGGRLVVEGSHHLVQSFYAQLKPSERMGQKHRDRFFYTHPYFAELTRKIADKGDRTRRFMEEHTAIDGVEVRVVELTGEPGDAVFYHPGLVSCIARNVADTPAFVRG